MIDWFSLLANSLWIFGLALALVILSYASWQASLAQQKFRVFLARPKIQGALDLAGVFFCLGLAATSNRWWEISLWVLLAVALVIQMMIPFVAAEQQRRLR